MNFNSQLRATAKPFLPALKMECCIAVRSLVNWEEGQALVPVDPVSLQVGLSDIQQFFPAANGLHFLQQKVDGTERLVSVCQSHSISKDQNGNICFGEKKFIPPKLGFNRIYYVTERDMQVESEEMAEVENVVEGVEGLLVDIKDYLGRLSRVHDRLKALKFRPSGEISRQTPQAFFSEAQPSFDSGYYTYSGINTLCEESTSPNPNNLQWSSSEKIKEKSVLCEPKPSYAAASSVEIETSDNTVFEDAAKNVSASREIMMMVDGKEVNIIATRPKLIKKSRPKLIKK